LREQDFQRWAEGESRILVPFRVMSDHDVRTKVESALWAYIWPLVPHTVEPQDLRPFTGSTIADCEAAVDRASVYSRAERASDAEDPPDGHLGATEKP